MSLSLFVCLSLCAGSQDDDEMDDDEEEDEEEEEGAASSSKGGVKMSRLAALNIPDEGYDEDEDCVNAEDEEYLKMLAEVDAKGDGARRRIYRNGELVGGELDSDDDDDDFEGPQFTSPVDAMDIFDHFKRTILAASAREPQLFLQLQESLVEEDKERLRKFLA